MKKIKQKRFYFKTEIPEYGLKINWIFILQVKFTFNKLLWSELARNMFCLLYFKQCKSKEKNNNQKS